MASTECLNRYRYPSLTTNTKATITTKGMGENYDGQNKLAAAQYVRAGLKRHPKKETDVSESEKKRGPLDDKELRESRERFQEEVDAAMPKLPLEAKGDYDIDIMDEFDPLLLGTYAKEIFAYLTVIEKHVGYPLKGLTASTTVESIKYVDEDKIPHLPRSQVRSLTEYARAKLINFMSNLSLTLSLCNETLYLAAQILDRVVSRETLRMNANGLTLRDTSLMANHKLLGLTCLFIANKYEDRYTPRLRQFVRCADIGVTTQDVISCERQILKTLDYELHCPTPVVFLRRFCRINDTPTAERYMAFLAGEMCFRSPVLSCVPPSRMAAALLATINKLVGKEPWSEKLVAYSNITLADIEGLMKDIKGFIKDYNRSFYDSCQKKFKQRQFYNAWNSLVDLLR